MIPYKQITIDLVPEVMPPEPLLTASQYDNGRPVEVTVQYGGEDYDLTGMTAKIQVRKPSGKVVIADAAQVSGSKVVFNLITQMTAEYGQILTELSLTGQNQEPIGTANWITYVEKSPASGSPSDTWVQDIDEKVEQATEAAEAAEQSQLWAEAWAVGERDGGTKEGRHGEPGGAGRAATKSENKVEEPSRTIRHDGSVPVVALQGQTQRNGCRTGLRRHTEGSERERHRATGPLLQAAA